MTSSGLLAEEKQEGDFGFLRVIYRDPLICWNGLGLWHSKDSVRGSEGASIAEMNVFGQKWSDAS